jgi:hypothetical protein
MNVSVLLVDSADCLLGFDGYEMHKVRTTQVLYSNLASGARAAPGFKETADEKEYSKKIKGLGVF